MNERPILFTGAMVRAILDGTKSSTRRVVNPQPELSPNSEWWHWRPKGQAHWRNGENPTPNFATAPLFDHCPYGKAGDRLWVRETWHPAFRFGTEYEIEYKADGASRMIDAGWNGPTPIIDAAISKGWQLPSTIPRWASRIALQITAVRVERLQMIDEAAVIAEGVFDPTWTRVDDNARKAYAAQWDATNAKRGFGWDANPWVWVIDFVRVG